MEGEESQAKCPGFSRLSFGVSGGRVLGCSVSTDCTILSKSLGQVVTGDSDV